MKEHLIFDWKIQVVTLSIFPPFALPPISCKPCDRKGQRIFVNERNNGTSVRTFTASLFFFSTFLSIFCFMLLFFPCKDVKRTHKNTHKLKWFFFH